MCCSPLPTPSPHTQASPTTSHSPSLHYTTVAKASLYTPEGLCPHPMGAFLPYGVSDASTSHVRVEGVHRLYCQPDFLTPACATPPPSPPSSHPSDPVASKVDCFPTPAAGLCRPLMSAPALVAPSSLPSPSEQQVTQISGQTWPVHIFYPLIV